MCEHSLRQGMTVKPNHSSTKPPCGSSWKRGVPPLLLKISPARQKFPGALFIATAPVNNSSPANFLPKTWWPWPWSWTAAGNRIRPQKKSLPPSSTMSARSMTPIPSCSATCSLTITVISAKWPPACPARSECSSIPSPKGWLPVRFPHETATS
jgi:hypothetical protein